MSNNSERNDEAERWLRANDPQYAQRSRAWRTPKQDALEHLQTNATERKRETLGAPVVTDHTEVRDDRLFVGGVLVTAPGVKNTPAALGNGGYYRRASREGDGESDE